MKKAYLHLVKYALDNNATVSVHDSEEWAVKRSTSYADIKTAIESVDISSLRIRDRATGEVLGWAGIVLESGQSPEESVYDYEVCPLLDAWDAAYRAESNF